ncbi:MAG: tetratricopeptide repeat protein, partial [Alphaproteobacteria bacterium]
HWTLLYARGIALERSKQWPRAEADLLRALEFRPEQALVLNYLGYSWADRGENLERAREMIERAVALRPNDGYIVDSLGWVHYRMGQYDKAVIHLERALELKSGDAVITDHLGDAYWQAGRKTEARFQWRRALTLDADQDLRRSIQLKLEHGLGATNRAANPG